MYGGYYFYDSSWIVLIPAMIFTIIAQAKVRKAYSVYSDVYNSKGITGAEAARKMMDANGLRGVAINILQGDSLNNYYNPRNRSLNLSEEVYNSRSVAAISIACHEVGHAIQDKVSYRPLVLRNNIVPVVNITQRFSWPLIILGLFLSTISPYGSLMFVIGVFCFIVVILFHLITLPVEFNASNRALQQMDEIGILESSEDYTGSKAVLNVAAMTYIAALATAVASLLRILIISSRRR